MTPLDAAIAWIQQGFSPVPIPHRSKRPVLQGWERLEITVDAAPQYFNGTTRGSRRRLPFPFLEEFPMTEPNQATKVKNESANAATSLPRLTRLSELSAPRQALIRLCQSVNFGQIRSLEIRDSDPVFSPPPEVLFEVKLDSDVVPRTELDLPDFVLPAEVCRLMERLDHLKTGMIERIEVRDGVARRIIFKAFLTEAPR